MDEKTTERVCIRFQFKLQETAGAVIMSFPFLNIQITVFSGPL